MYSRIYTRLDWFFGYIGEPEDEEFVPDLYGDINFDGVLNVTDIILIVNIVLNVDEEISEQEFITADINQDGIINILDVIGVVSEILGTSFSQSVIWLEENYPELKTKERLSNLDKSKYFVK